jgi:hypothetical protein
MPPRRVAQEPNMSPKKKAKQTKTTKSPSREGALIVLMDPEVRALIDKAAKSAGLATGTYLRTAALDRARKDLKSA